MELVAMRELLLQKAWEVRERAYAPYSDFAVGAALLSNTGVVYTGCNVENASYGLSNCAERTAVFHMVAQGETKFVALAVVADAPRAISPCGACRQVLCEFGEAKTPVWLANVHGDEKFYTLDDLLPYAFFREDLSKDD